MHYFLAFVSVCLYAYCVLCFWPCVCELTVIHLRIPSTSTRSSHLPTSLSSSRSSTRKASITWTPPITLNTISYCILILYAYKEEDTPKIRDTIGTVFIQGPSIVLPVWRCIMFNGSYLRACRILRFVKKIWFFLLDSGRTMPWCRGLVSRPSAKA